MKLMIRFLFQLRLEVLELGESWIMQRGHLPRVGSKSEKIDRYAPAFENSDYDFAPVVFETSGALSREGETVLKQIIRFASKREGISHSVFAARAWARLSCCIQFAAAQQILNRDYTEPVVADIFV